MISFQGTNVVLGNIAAVARKSKTVTKRAVREFAEEEMTEAKRRTPVDTGELRASGHVTMGETENGGVRAELAFGGPAAPYALTVHEDLEAFHKVGQAKFLESVLNESARYFLARVGAKIKSGFGL